MNGYVSTTLGRVGSPRNSRILAWMIGSLFVATAVALVFTPWQQNIVGKGRVVAFAPIERRQHIEASIDGRIVRWAVVEGSRVNKGDLIVEISDNDPSILERLDQERSAMSGTLGAAGEKAASMREMMLRLEETRLKAMSAARSRIAVASDRVQAAGQSLQAAEADQLTAKLNFDRQQKLAGKGLTSTRNMELATLALNKTTADVDKAKATLNAERNGMAAAEADLDRIDADARAKIQDARGYVAAAVSDSEKARAEIAKVNVRLARQNTQTVTAPANGVIFRVVARQGGDMVKAGDVLAEIVPDSSSDVVELWVDGNDAPLISAGRPVRLQFEGWPALQFSGWPSIAVGTFGGRVLLVDAADNGNGDFRILVGPDPNDEQWPSRPWLRQGVQANGWVLLNQVALGYELWRQFNGFPPVIAMTEPGKAGK